MLVAVLTGKILSPFTAISSVKTWLYYTSLYVQKQSASETQGQEATSGEALGLYALLLALKGLGWPL